MMRGRARRCVIILDNTLTMFDVVWARVMVCDELCLRMMMCDDVWLCSRLCDENVTDNVWGCVCANDGFTCSVIVSLTVGVTVDVSICGSKRVIVVSASAASERQCQCLCWRHRRCQRQSNNNYSFCDSWYNCIITASDHDIITFMHYHYTIISSHHQIIMASSHHISTQWHRHINTSSDHHISANIITQYQTTSHPTTAHRNSSYDIVPDHTS